MANIYNNGRIADWFQRGVIAVVLSTAIIYVVGTMLSDHSKIQDHDMRIGVVEKKTDALSDMPSRMTRVETEIHQNTLSTNTLTEAILTGKIRRPEIKEDGK